jgi:hypothetical protein
LQVWRAGRGYSLAIGFPCWCGRCGCCHNLNTGGHRWHALPLLGWGLGLAIHGLVTWLSLRGDGLHQRMLDREIRRLEQRR